MTDWIANVLEPGIAATLARPKAGNWLADAMSEWDARIDMAIGSGALDESERQRARDRLRQAIRAVPGVTVREVAFKTEARATGRPIEREDPN